MADTSATTRGGARRRGLRRSLSRRSAGWRELIRRPRFGWALVILTAYAAAATALVSATRETPRLVEGRVMDETRVARVDFEIQDLAATEQEREIRRRSTPRRYVANRAALEAVQRSLEGLPTALADAETIEQVAEGIRDEFRLDEERLAAIRGEAMGGESSPRWRQSVRDLVSELRLTPVLTRDEYQLEMQEANSQVELEFRDAEQPVLLGKSLVVNVAGAQLEPVVSRAVRRAGFAGETHEMVVEWLVRTMRPTFSFDPAATAERKEERAAAVAIQTTRQAAGDVLYRRGDQLTRSQREAALKEFAAWRDGQTAIERWAPRLAAFGVVVITAFAASVYVSAFCPRLSKNTTRAAVLASLSAALLGLLALGAAGAPGMTTLWMVAAVSFFAMIMATAYDQRVALSLSLLHALLMAIALGLSAGEYGVLLVVAGTAVWRLREIRHRNALVVAGLVTGLAAAAASALVGFLTRPDAPGVLHEVLLTAAQAGVGAVGATVVLMALLPTIEKIFNITTGMTLIELRDPKHPLLRELQQRAPGTYSHSMTVATLAESAADAIGADGLEVYVGALYHDVGKMNKPDYFVENQPPGFNRHEKLSPTMSLLVILGHVKDGVELAREYGLPRSLYHYIESHHGTTLVAYFFRQAQELADIQDEDRPAETEYRYPGPKPRTKEAAILMLCDAVESATRALTDPTPSRIESLVHELSMKRLQDGQFDESGLTFRELSRVEHRIAKTLSSIYHGRIAYPSSERGDKGERRSGERAMPQTQMETSAGGDGAVAGDEPTAARGVSAS